MVRAFIDLGNKINAMNPIFTKKLSLQVWKSEVKAQKIDSLTLKTLGILIVFFSMNNKAGKLWFFEENFLLTDISMDIALSIAFLILSNTKINFLE